MLWLSVRCDLALYLVVKMALHPYARHAKVVGRVSGRIVMIIGSAGPGVGFCEVDILVPILL